MGLDGDTTRLAIAVVLFVLSVAGAGLTLIKIFFGRVFAAIKTLFEAKEEFEKRMRLLERNINRVEKTILVMDPNQTQILKDHH